VLALASLPVWVFSCASSDKAPTAPVQSARPSQVTREPHVGVHNVIEVAPGLISGSVPEGLDGFAELKRRGVRTVVCVDGATPDVATARRFGMRYVHLPIGYDGIDRTRQLEIARAVRDLPEPVYVHCHHGKHRGPAAAASAAVLLGKLSADEAVAFLKKAGTSDNYAGLYACVQNRRAASDSELESAAAAFPEIAPVPGFVKAMSQVQAAYDHLVEIRHAGWQTPTTHPDLVPLAEAGRLENLLRQLQNDPRCDEHPADFAQMLEASWKASREFERALAEGTPANELITTLEQVRSSCRECHSVYRNNR